LDKEASVPYRKDLDVMRAREAELLRELATLEAAEERLRSLKANESDLRCELADVRTRLDPWRAGAEGAAQSGLGDLRVEDLRVASPCSASWEHMVGDDKRRFCDDCGQSVYNASALTRAELEALLGAHAYQLCLRMYRREDGTVMTTDCPVGKRRVRLKQVAAVACGSVLAGIAVAAVAHEVSKPRLDELYSVHVEAPGGHHYLTEQAGSVLQPDAVVDGREPPQAEAKPHVTPSHRIEPHHTMGALIRPPRSKGGAACDTPAKKYEL
jgi:hypothetical protein